MMSKKEQLLEAYSQWLQMRNYSQQTYKAYMGSVRKFWVFCDGRKSDAKFNKDNAVQTYLAHRLTVEKRDYSTVNGDYSALQWFYKYVLDRDWNVRKLIRPRKEKRLPRYITPEQVALLLENTSYDKHRLMILMYYCTGMRLSEVRFLKWGDINFSEGVIMVKKGKGNKDRMAILPAGLDEQLQRFKTLQRPTQQYVFEGKTPGIPIAPKTIQWGIVLARKKAGLPEWVTAHVLRHSYATIHLKNGMDVVGLQKLLGHKKLSTTTRYLHLNIKHYQNGYNPLKESCLNAYLIHPALPSAELSDNSPLAS
jgi:integrase/recombinase XerD